MQPYGDAAEPPDLSLDSDEVSGVASYPFSLPSQPPDIRNWFSSYEYESPECLEVPHGVHYSLQPEGDDDATQDPLEDPPAFQQNYLVEQKENASSPEGCNLAYEFRSRADSLLLKETKISSIQTEWKPQPEKSRGDNGDDKCKLLDSHQCSIGSRISLPGRLLEETNWKESVSRGDQMAVGSLQEDSLDKAAIRSFPCRELSRQFADKEDGFVSVKNKDSIGSNYETWSRRPILKENLRGFTRDKCDQNSKIQLHLDANFDGSNQDSDPAKKQNSGVKPKRKLNLQKLLGVEPLAKQCVSCPIQSKGHGCSLDASPVESKDIQRMGAKNLKNIEPAFLEADCRSKDPNEITCQERLLVPGSNGRGPKEHEMEIHVFTAVSKENSERTFVPHIEATTPTVEHSKTAADTVMTEGAEHELMDYCNGTLAAAKEQAQVRKRGPLTDRTNSQVEGAALASGKWQCPRKGKPDMEPPLKQLRLGRWLRPI